MTQTANLSGNLSGGTDAAAATAATHAAPAARGAEAKLLLALVLAVVLWGGAIALWGLPGLILPAVVLTPLMILTLVLISAGG